MPQDVPLLTRSTYKVSEIFKSVQGEGSFMGMTVVFVRLSGCNLACRWCDTKEQLQKGVMVYNLPVLVESIKALDREQGEIPCMTVVITGGEPTLQDIPTLVAALTKEGYFVCMETNGVMSITDHPKFKSQIEDNELQMWITVSPKPDAHWKLPPLGSFAEVKYVCDEAFVHYFKTNQLSAIVPKELLSGQYGIPIFLQPQDGWDKSAEWVYKICTSLPVFRHGVQMHKVFKFQ